MARGKRGFVWRLDTSDGSWAVKVPHRPAREDEARVAAAFQEAAFRAGVPTPQVRRTTDGTVFARVQGAQLRVYEWVELGAPDARLDPAAVGSVLATMHLVSEAADGPVEDWYGKPVGAARWGELISDLRNAGAPFAGRLADLHDELVALESWIEPPNTIQVCHRDLWADNIRPIADGGVSVIDWEDSGPADPAHEFACVLFEFARSDPARARTLARAYRDAGGPAEVTRRGHFSMLIAQLGHIAEAAVCDWLNPNPRSPDRADSAAWIAEMLDEPHTRRLLDTLLDDARQASR